MPVESGAGMAYRSTSSTPVLSSRPSSRKAAGVGSTPAIAWSRAKARISRSNLARAWVATVSGRASCTRRASTPITAWTPSSTTAWRSQPEPSTSGSRALPLMPSLRPPRRAP